MSGHVVVAGAGRSGLHAARLLAGRGLAVTVVERLPHPGGQEPEPGTARLAATARNTGARFLLATMVVSLTGQHAETLGISGAQRLPADALVVATGSRPATLAELRISGDRCAGILPGSAAIHLIEAGVLPGWNPVVLGSGDLAQHCLTACLRAGAQCVSAVRPAPATFTVPPRAGAYDGWELDSIQGGPRVRRVVLSKDGDTLTVQADAVVLAHGRRPMRNIDNALHDTGIVVGCHSAADPKTDEDAVSTAADAAAQVMKILGHNLAGA
jgi:NADPH-dependent 2,4-dienoyl-CoA reductase/sulfur reductase-like enzyme